MAEPGRVPNAGPAAEDDVTEWLGGPGHGAEPGSEPGRPGIRLLAGAVIVVLAAALLGVVLARSLGRSPGRLPAARPQNQAATMEQAASWVARQVSPDAGVSCDPAMCAALKAHGFPARDLLVLGPRSQIPVDFAVVVETPAVLSLYGTSLATAWAPAVIASFGSGPAAIVVRAMAPNGAVAYQSALSNDLASRKSAGAALLRDRRVTVPVPARAQLTDGDVDPRLLQALAALAGHRPVSIVRFGDDGPGADPAVPCRSVDLAENAGAARLAPAAYVRSVRAYLSSVDSKFRPDSMTMAVLAHGQAVLRVEFTAPSPLGILPASASARG
jgi:hypothetical protein